MIRFAVDSIDAAREGPIVAGRIAEGTVRLGSTSLKSSEGINFDELFVSL